MPSNKDTKKIKKSRRSKSRRNASRLSAPRFVSAALSARMPVGSNYLRAPAILHSTRNHQGRTFRNARKELFPGLKRQPPIYRYPPTNQTRSQVYPGSRRPLTAIEVHPFGFAEPSKSLHNSLKALPAASIPRGYRQSLLKEAVAVPVQTMLAEPGLPNWGLMYDATQSLMPNLIRPMTADETRKETEFRRLESIRRSGGPSVTIGPWAPSRIQLEGRRPITLEEMKQFNIRYPEHHDLMRIIRDGSPDEQIEARQQIRELLRH